MGIFRKRRRLNSAASILNTPVPPPKVEVHNAAASYVGLALVAVMSVPFLFIVTWYSLVYLARQYGSRHPEKAVIDIMIGLAVLAIILLIAKIVFDSFIAKRYEHIERMMEYNLEVVRLQQRHVQTLPADTAHRMTDEQQRLYRAVMQAMADGYKQIDDTGKLTGKAEPWSKRSVGAMTLIDEQSPIGSDSALATSVKRYLLSADILLNDRTVNVDRFPDLDAVERRLNYDFGPLVQVRRSLPTPSQTQTEWSIIEQN